MKMKTILSSLGVLVLVSFFSIATAYSTEVVNVIYINGIQNTGPMAAATMVRIKQILGASVNHSAPDKKIPFSVSVVWNPIGWYGSGCNLTQDKMELFLLKTAEENYATDLQKLS